MSRKQTWWVAAIVASIALAAGLSLALRHFSTSGAGMSAEAFFAQTFNDLDGQPVGLRQHVQRVRPHPVAGVVSSGHALDLPFHGGNMGSVWRPCRGQGGKFAGNIKLASSAGFGVYF